MSDDEQARDDKRQRQMDFILEQQAQFSTDIQQIKETLAVHIEEADTRHEQTQQALHALIVRQEVLTEGQERNSAAIEALTLQQRLAFDAIFALTESQNRTTADVRNLTAVVNRVTEAVADLIERDGGQANGAQRNGKRDDG